MRRFLEVVPASFRARLRQGARLPGPMLSCSPWRVALYDRQGFSCLACGSAKRFRLPH